MVSVWWAGNSTPELNQGDLIASLPQGRLVHPVVHLQPATMAKQKPGFAIVAEPKPKADGSSMLAKGYLQVAMVLSHGCEIDKARGRILVATVAPMAAVHPEHQRQIYALESWAHFPLQGVPGIGDCYADLRAMSTLEAAAVQVDRRVVSMSADAQALLQAQLVGFFTRLKLPAMTG